ncbi:MAG: AMP-binding protein [Thermodesulfovibrio sp.]|nr:AMP-binding protein [Thermodesulfovibrio sp.]
MSLTSIFLKSFQTYKDKIAFNYPLKTEGYYKWQSFTYEDIKNYSIKICSFIQNQVSPEDKVILYAENSPWWCISYIGIILSGAIAVPVDVEIDRQTLETIISDSEAKLILYSEKTADKIVNYKGFNIEKIGDLQSPDHKDFAQTQDETIASIIYTSGTTGSPKAVILTHANFMFEIEAIKKTDIIGSDENVLCILPLHHTYPFVCGFLVPFSLGATVTFLLQIKGDELLKTIKTLNITAMVAVPKLLELFRNRILEKFKKFPLSLVFIRLKAISSYLRRKFDINIGKYLFFPLHLKTGFQFKFFTSGGARLDPEVMKDLEALGFTIVEGYGLTETSPVVSFNPKDRRKPGSAGKPLQGVELKILDPDENGVGEIAIKGPLVMRGYYKNEELTRESIQNGWFLTGDLGYIDKDGYLFITGRKKDIIVLSSGKTVYPEDVEESYKKMIPLIKEICLLDTMEAIIVPDINYAKQKGILNIKSNLKWQLDSVSRNFPPYMRIKGFQLHNEDLPKTRLGKFKRFLIKETIHQKIKEKEQKVDSKMLDKTGKAIENIIKSIIPSIKAIQPSDHLELDIGMDSINRIEFVLALEKDFSITLTDNIVNKWITVADVIEDIERLKHTVPVEKTPYKKSRGSFFRLASLFILMNAHFLLKLFFKIFFRLKVYGLENLPPPPFIITPNHTSYFDGFVVFASLPLKISRNLHFQGLKKFFPNRFIAELINVIPVSSDKDLIIAMESSKWILKKGLSLCIFPEGGRSFDGKIREFKKGFANLSIETGVPVVPVIINGTFEVLPRGKIIPKLGRISVFIDKAVNPPFSLSEIEAFMEEIRKRMIFLQKKES